MEDNDSMVNVPLLILPRLFLFLIINPIMQMKIIHSPNIPPTTEATAIAIGAESAVELNVVFIVSILVAVVIIWIFVLG